MTIDLLTNKDLDEFYGIFSKILSTQFPGYTPTVIDYFLDKIYTRISYRYWLDQNHKTIFIPREDNKIVGFAVIDQTYGGVSFLRWLGILPAHQRKGLGKALVTQWIEHAYDDGAHKAEVAGQPEAKLFYEKMGLELEGMRKASYFGIDQYVFGKVLNDPRDENMVKY